MRKWLATICVSVLLYGGATKVAAAEFGTRAGFEALVKKAINLIKTEGKEKAFAQLSDPKGKFVDRDLYITVYDLHGRFWRTEPIPK